MNYEEMTDLEIKQHKTKLHYQRNTATPQQDREIAAEMRRAQEVINRRQRLRTQEYQRIAAETQGSVSTIIFGVPATGGAAGHTKGGF